jgi:integrase
VSNLRKVPYTKPTPACAEIVKHKGKPHARFKDKRGMTVLAPLTDDGRRVRLWSCKWYGEYRDKDGIEQCVPLSTDKTAAEQMLAELVRKAERGRANLLDPYEEHRKRPLTEHLNDYRRYLKAEGNCAEYVAKTCARIQAILDGCRFVFIPDLSAAKAAEFLHGLRKDPARPELPRGKESFTPRELVAALGGVRPPRLARLLRRERLAVEGNGKARRYPRATVEAVQDHLCRGIGVSTSNGYLTAIKGFSRWLFKNERTERDRLVSLKRLNAKTDLRHERRALIEVELQAVLMAAGRSAADFLGLTGLERLMIYATAMVTGFRASELASLDPSSFDLDADPPTATVKAAYSKNRRKSVQPLPPDVAEALRRYLPSRPAGCPLWPGTWHKDAAEMLRLDLEVAGIPYRDSDGRVADFHALRHSYITLLERSGVSPKLAQELARHSDIRLTMNVYTHARLHDLAGAVEGLPALLPADPPTQAQNLRATGTEGARALDPTTQSLRPACATIEVGCDSVRTVENLLMENHEQQAERKYLELQAVENVCDGMRVIERKLPGQDSNLDKENQNPLSTSRNKLTRKDFRPNQGRGCTLVAQSGPSFPPTWPGWWMPGRCCPNTSAAPS